MILLENCSIPEENAPKNVLIEGNKIAEITSNSLQCENRIDCSGKLLLPGLIDSHVHFRVPGGEHKEDWKHASRAAVAGGVTTVLDMPNTNPATTTLELLEEKRAVAFRDSYCNFGLFLGATKNNHDEIERAERIAGIKLYAGSSTGNLLVEKNSDILHVFEAAYRHNRCVVVHAEHEKTIKENTLKAKRNSWNHAQYHSKIRTPEAEAMSVEQLLGIQKKVGNKLHIAHVSSRVSLDLIREAKKEGYWITAEACPHHLFLSEAATTTQENFAKMNPSLKSQWDTRALWRGITSGVIDTIATDHAPHTVHEKKQDYYSAPAGVPGVQTMLPLLLTAIQAGKISLPQVVKACCTNPSKIFGIKNRSIIKEGAFADMVVVDPGKKETISNDRQYSKCGWTCFNGTLTRGVVEKTFVNGTMVFNNHAFFESRGQEVY